MATLEINGRRVQVSDEFRSLSPEEQERTVAEIAASFGGGPSEPADMGAGGRVRSAVSGAVSGVPVVGPAIERGAQSLAAGMESLVTSKPYEQARGEQAARTEGAAEAHPGYHTGGQIAGAVGSMVPVGATALGARALGITGRNIGTRMGAALASGAGIGAADTLARGGSGGEAMDSAVAGGLIGAAVPPVFEGAGAALRAGGQAIASRVRTITSPEGEAARRVGEAVRRDGAAGQSMRPDDYASAGANGQDVRLMDTGGEAVRGLTRSAVNTSPDAGNAIREVAQDRFHGQGERYTAFVSRLMGGRTDDLAALDQLQDAARMANGPAYRKAAKAPGADAMWHEGFGQLMTAPAMQKAARQAVTRGANRAATEGFTPVANPFVKGADGRIALATRPDGSQALPSLRFWDQVKRNLDSQIGTADRAGDRAMAGDLKALKGQLVSMMDEAVPAYREARQGAAAFFGAEDALEAGKMFANKPKQGPEMERALGTMTDPERKLFQVGFASELTDAIRAAPDSRNVTNMVFGSPARRDQMRAVFGADGFERFEAFTRVEAAMHATKTALGNSTTARQLVELGVAGGMGAGGGYALGGDPTSALVGAAMAAGARKGGQAAGQRLNERVVRHVAELLVSDDPKAIEAAARMAYRRPEAAEALDAIHAVTSGLRGSATASGGSIARDD